MYKPEDWEFTRADDIRHHNYPYWMDIRHVAFIYQALMLNCFRRVLEIGCWDGSSTSALVQAANDGCETEIHLCDIDFRVKLREVISRCRKRVHFHEGKSVDVLSSDYDLVILDGDHRLETVEKEVNAMLSYQQLTLIAHDTNASMVPGCEGTCYLGKTFRDHEAYHCLEDSERRPGEYTERGLLFATRDASIFAKLHPLWQIVMMRSYVADHRSN